LLSLALSQWVQSFRDTRPGCLIGQALPLLLCVSLLLGCSSAPSKPPAVAETAQPLSVAVVGGIGLCGVWDKLVPKIEVATGVKIDLASLSNKEGILPDFRSGKAALLLVHGGEETFQFQAEGIGGQQRAWGYNEHVIVGPENDPAGVASAPKAGAAFKRMAESRSPFVAFRDPGSHAMVQKVWRRTGLKPSTDWVLLDETADPHEILGFTAGKHAYVVVGHIPVAFGKLSAPGMKVLLKGDPDLRKAYVAMEPGPNHAASPEAREQARKVADFLVSPEGQAALEAANAEAGGPWIFPLSGAKEMKSGPGRQGGGNGRGRRMAPSGSPESTGGGR